MNEKETRGILSEVRFFKGMDSSQLDALAEKAETKSYAQGKYLAHEGDDADAFFLLLEGKVEILIDSGQGPRRLQTIGPGEIFGWSWIFPPYRWNFDARAVDPVKVLALAGKSLRKRCEQNPEMGYHLMKRFAGIMVSRLRATRLQVLDVYAQPKGEKLTWIPQA